MNDQNLTDVRIPVYAGMFARAAYPTDKAFFMTYRFELEEPVNEECLRKAWEKAVKVYPYLSWAVRIRDGKYVMTENPLPFVFCETSEIIEPFKEAGNYHTTTICYKEKNLYLYIDHVPFDGTGVQFCLETFFYYYFCFLDSISYPVPEGVLTEKDIPVEGLAEDAYLSVDPIDPMGKMDAYATAGMFSLPENPRNGAFVSMEDCGTFCITVPKKELMGYAKKVSGTPMSVIAVLTAKSMERVHPENTLPVKITAPVSVRKVMGNVHSLQHQVVHTGYPFDPEKLKEEDSEESLNKEFRSFLKSFMSEENIRFRCGVYSGIVQGLLEAHKKGVLDETIMQQRAGAESWIGVSYLGILRTGEYGKRIKMKAFHGMPERGIMLQAAEIGGAFCLCWYQGFHDDCYVRGFTNRMHEIGMHGAVYERV